MTSFDLAIGRGTLRQLHASLANHAPDQAVTILQEAGYAAGEAIYKAFASWLPERTGVDSPGNLDADLLAETLSDFFTSGGWGTVTMSPVGTGALAIDSDDWAEAEPGSAQSPMCFFTAGMWRIFWDDCRRRLSRSWRSSAAAAAMRVAAFCPRHRRFWRRSITR